MEEHPPEWSAESAYAEFVKRFETLAEAELTSNEAETRLKIIDSILFEILDWDKANVEVEKYCREVGFADYVFSIRSSVCLVVEAKRAGIPFVIKEAVFTPEPVTFALLEQECKPAGQALRQALGYAAGLGSRYIAISNGSQWLLALTYVQSQSLDDRQVIVFDGLKCIKENFRRFWNCFSRRAVGENEIASVLLESRKKPAPAKLSSSIPGYPVSSQRNIFVNELSYVLNTVWDVLSRTENTLTFLETCYVAPKSNEHLIAFAKDLLNRRLAADALMRDSSVLSAAASELQDTIIGYDNEKPFVILGDVGHGKTTFLNHLRLVAACETFKGYIQIQVDFLDRPDNSIEVNDFIYRQIEAQLLDVHGIDIFEDSIVRGALHTQIERFYRSSRYKLGKRDDQGNATREETLFIQEQIKDRHEYYKSLIRHLKRGRGKSVAVFFDNLDRRDSSIQEAAFLKASAIARDWECVVFICLRPSTFYESLKRGLLDSLAPKTFTVGSPELSLVLKKRFKFAERLALGEIDTPILQEALKSKEISFRLPNVAAIFACCEFSARREASAIQMLIALSNGNIRNLLELTKRTLASGHLDTQKISEKITESGKYYIPDFEAVKTLLYGDYDQYDPKYSIFVNLFDIYHADPKEHFIRILALYHLNKFGNKDEARSWTPYADILSYLESFYFDVATIQRHLKILIEAGCIDSSVDSTKDVVRTSQLCITTRGAYHLNNLAAEFQYVDAMTVDTPITCNDASQGIPNATRIAERIQRTQCFLNYLQKCSSLLADGEGQAVCGNILKLALENCVAVEERSKNRIFPRSKFYRPKF